MKVKLKLVNQGVKNHPLFWIVAIPYRKKISGVFLEKLGYWRPRYTKSYDRSISLNIPKIKYWLGNGAIPSASVHKILERFELVPHRPPPFGSKYQYERPKKGYSDARMKLFMRTNKLDYDQEIRTKISNEIGLIEKRLVFEQTLYDDVDIENARTTDIDSDEPSTIDRNIKFEEIKKRFDSHKKYSLDVLKGNDYKFNIYIRKMKKLSQARTGGLDLDGYKDYLNNLMEFKKIKGEMLMEKDTILDDEIKIDYSGINLEDVNTPIGHPKKQHYDIKTVMSIREKKQRLEKMKTMLVDILKSEIEMRRQYESQYQDFEKLEQDTNSYARNRESDGRSENFLIEEEMIEEYANKNNINSDLNTKNLNFMKETGSDIAFLNEYDSTEEEITVKLVEYLYDNPHLFRKIRFLQRNNKVLNLEEIPESKKLSEIKSMIINSKSGDHYDNSSLKWLRNTDKEFQETYGKRADDVLQAKSRLRSGEIRNLDKINIEELENAMTVLVEGYKRVMKGEKEVKLSEILKSVNLKTPNGRVELENSEVHQETQKIQEGYSTRSKHVMPTIESSRKDYENELAAEKLESESDNPEQPDAAEQQPAEENEGKEEKETEGGKEAKSEEDALNKKISEESKAFYNDIAGRYVPGFRHYENYESYSLKFPEKNIQDYVNDMHREATFGEFCEIFKAAFRFYSRVNPNLRLEILKKTEGRPEVLEWVLDSEIFEDKLKSDYQHRLRTFLGLKKIYTFVDCLEEFTDLVYFGDPFTIPTHSVHIPSEG